MSYWKRRESECLGSDARVYRTFNDLERNTTIHPNPDKGTFVITVKDNATCTYRVFNHQGKQISESKVLYRQAEVALEGMASGIYLVEISSG